MLVGNALFTTRIVFSQFVGHSIFAVGTLTCTGVYDRSVVFTGGVPDRAVRASDWPSEALTEESAEGRTGTLPALGHWNGPSAGFLPARGPSSRSSAPLDAPG